jgi:NADH-quinone oxidoreductase subunit C
MKEIIDHLKERFSITDVVVSQPGQFFVTVAKENLIPMITSLKINHDFRVLVIISAVDWIEKGKFQLTYAINNPDAKQDIAIRVFIDREKPEMDSIHKLWKHVATFQREIYEMFGISFPGSPGLTEPFFLEGWDNIPPMRRDFDTRKYSEDTYFPRPGRETNDPANYMKQKLYPDE